MSDKLVIGPINKGLRNDRTAFNIDNDSFPTLINAYQWRGRVKRKRGTSLLGRLTREIFTQSIGTTGASPWTFNLYTSITPSITAEPNASIAPGSVTIFLNVSNITGSIVTPGYTIASNCEVYTTPTGLNNGDQVTISGVVVVPNSGPADINGGPYVIEVLSSSFKIQVDSHSWGTWQSGGTWTKIVGAIIFTDQGDGTLTSTTPGNSGTINYLTGSVTLTHTAGAGVSADATFEYYPTLPVMGLEDVLLNDTVYVQTMAFDTKYPYLISNYEPYEIHNVNYYKNPSSGSYPGYTAKATDTSFVFNGEDYQQFWSTNYENAFWVTNGITVPFNINNIGMQYSGITNIGTITGNTVQLTVTGPNLVVGDFVFLNEFDTTKITGINFQTGYIIAGSSPGVITVELPNAALAGPGGATVLGIVQYLTNNAFPTKDCIKWYDGDPTNSTNGWVNFAPPLSFGTYSIGGSPQSQWYLVGARVLLPFKDRLLAFGPVIQTSAQGSQIYLQDTVIYSQNGTPFYTASFTGDPTLSTTEFTPILTPLIETATSFIQSVSAPAWWEDQTGFGGFITAGLNQPINSVGSNEDVLIVGFNTIQTKLIYSGSDVTPFNFFLINSELGSGSIFSAITLDKVVLTRGTRGFIGTSQVQTVRIDLPIPDQVFQIRLLDNGSERFTAARDFINEWIYFTYTSAADNYEGDTISNKFPNQTLQYNYRDDTWAIFNECYTTYGNFQELTGFTWATVGNIFPTWEQWNEPWDAGSSEILQPKVIGGNQQGFIIFRDDGTGESVSLAIQNIVGSVVTSPDHTLNNGDFIIISGVLGTLGSQVNGQTFQVSSTTTTTFTLDPPLTSGTYLGGGLITRLYVPFIQTRQFPAAWDMAKKTRIGVQRYLLTRTDLGQIQLLIYLSQDDSNPYNDGPIVPDINSQNDGLIYSTVLFTCPESTNLGLTPANTNLQQLTLVAGTSSANNQQQLWHRINTSLIGDTVQLGFTISDDQMTSLTPSGPSFAITGITLGSPTILTTTAAYTTGQLVQINDVIGTVELNYSTNGNIVYNVLSSSSTTVTLEVDSTAFTSYISGGTVIQVFNFNQFAEIELHSAILDLSPSMELI